MPKKRLDLLLTEKGFVQSRTKAQALIMSGLVFVDGQNHDKSGSLVDESANIHIKEKFPYVSRGALKIEEAYKHFHLNFQDKIICDIGSSTGGFSDFSLSMGASKVFAIDVGTGQLDQKIRNDDRVVVMENTDFRDVTVLSDEVDFFLADVSFISLKKIIPGIKNLMSDGSQIVLLVKPQFEVGKKEADRGKGVIRDQAIREKALGDIIVFAESLNLNKLGLVESPIKGAKGNMNIYWARLIY
jgi:23S rRNA (cytidine1920-2'-O)/16S rRNA (cytidine1409-2'-O)-methyltransferase